VISHSGIVWMNCYFITPIFYFFILINFACNCDSCFPCDNLLVLCVQGQHCHYHRCAACVPSTVASLVAALEPAVNNCERATCPSRISAAFLKAYCTTDNCNDFNPFDERTLVVVCGADLGCTVIWCGVGISAGILYLTILEQKIFFLYV